MSHKDRYIGVVSGRAYPRATLDPQYETLELDANGIRTLGPQYRGRSVNFDHGSRVVGRCIDSNAEDGSINVTLAIHREAEDIFKDIKRGALGMSLEFGHRIARGTGGITRVPLDIAVTSTPRHDGCHFSVVSSANERSTGADVVYSVGVEGITDVTREYPHINDNATSSMTEIATLETMLAEKKAAAALASKPTGVASVAIGQPPVQSPDMARAMAEANVGEVSSAATPVVPLTSSQQHPDPVNDLMAQQMRRIEEASGRLSDTMQLLNKSDQRNDELLARNTNLETEVTTHRKRTRDLATQLEQMVEAKTRDATVHAGFLDLRRQRLLGDAVDEDSAKSILSSLMFPATGTTPSFEAVHDLAVTVAASQATTAAQVQEVYHRSLQHDEQTSEAQALLDRVSQKYTTNGNVEPPTGLVSIAAEVPVMASGSVTTTSSRGPSAATQALQAQNFTLRDARREGDRGDSASLVALAMGDTHPTDIHM